MTFPYTPATTCSCSYLWIQRPESRTTSIGSSALLGSWSQSCEVIDVRMRCHGKVITCCNILHTATCITLKYIYIYIISCFWGPVVLPESDFTMKQFVKKVTTQSEAPRVAILDDGGIVPWDRCEKCGGQNGDLKYFKMVCGLISEIWTYRSFHCNCDRRSVCW